VKVFAGRRKDLEDVRGVLAEQRGRIDLARTRDVLSSLEAAIGEHKLLPRLDRLLRAADAKEEPCRPAPKTPTKKLKTTKSPAARRSRKRS
jgi:hypothetical protein